MDSNQTAFAVPTTQTIRRVKNLLSRGVELWKNATSIIFALRIIAEKLPNQVGTKIAQGLNSGQGLTTLPRKMIWKIDWLFTACSRMFESEGLAECVNRGFRPRPNTGQKRVPLFVTNPNKSALLPAPTRPQEIMNDEQWMMN